MVTIDLLIEDRHLVKLLFGQGNILKVIKYSHLLSSCYETVLELSKKLSEQYVNRFILHNFDHFLWTFRSVDHDFMRQTHLQGTELDDELLESFEV